MIAATIGPTAARTLVILALFFALAGLGICLRERAKGEKDDNLRQRYASWYMIAPVVLIPAYFGGIAFAILVGAIALWCLREYFGVVHVRENASYKWIGRLSGAALVAAAYIESTTSKAAIIGTLRRLDPSQHFLPAQLPADAPSVLHAVHPFYVLPVFIIMLVLLVPVLMRRYQGMVQQESFTILGILYFGWFLGHLVLLRNLDDGFGHIIFLTMTVVFNDVLAYTSGRLFGKHKLAPEISPKKTIEGAAGGLLGSLAAAFIFSYAVPSLSAGAVACGAILIGIAAPLGDLVVSVIKRDMSVKDSGTLIPGHGGLLDRCDSLIFATPVYYYFVRLVLHLTA